MTRTLAEPNLTPLADTGSARKALPNLSLDVNLATAQILASLSGGQALPADAFQQLLDLNRKLVDAPDDEILDSLTRQASLLEALWLHFAARATTQARSDHASSLLKAALNCQRALANTLGTVHHLHENRKVAEAVEPG